MSGITQAAPTTRDAPTKRLGAPSSPTLNTPSSLLPGSPVSPFCPGLPSRPGIPGKPSLPSGARHVSSSSRAVPSTAARVLVTSQSPGCILPPCKDRGGGTGDGGKHTDAPWTQTCKCSPQRHGQIYHVTHLLSNTDSWTSHATEKITSWKDFEVVSLCDPKSLMLLQISDLCPWQGCGIRGPRTWSMA